MRRLIKSELSVILTLYQAHSLFLSLFVPLTLGLAFPLGLAFSLFLVSC